MRIPATQGVGGTGRLASQRKDEVTKVTWNPPATIPPLTQAAIEPSSLSSLDVIRTRAETLPVKEASDDYSPRRWGQVT